MSAHQASIRRLAMIGQVSGSQRLGLFIAFLACGLAVLVFGSNYFAIFPTNKNLTYQILLSALFLIGAAWFKRDERTHQYGQVAFAFFVASFATAVTSIIGGLSSAILSWFNLTVTTSQGTAIAKVYEMLMIVVPIVALTKMSGADIGAIYIRRGSWKWGASIGGLVLLNFAASAFLFFAMRFRSIESLGAALGWGLVFSFANAFMEELWVRGIFLKRFEPLLGMGGAVLATSIVFALMHAGATYTTPIAIPFYIVSTLTLGLACGYLIMKTDSIWGATLIHAASDLFLFIAMLASA